MDEKPRLKLVNSYDELEALVPGYKTRVKIDSDRDSKWMIYKGNSSEGQYFSFIEVPDTIEDDTEFIVRSSLGKYLSFPGDECISPDLESTIVFNDMLNETDVITPGSKEYEEIKSLVELWVKE